MANIAAFDTSNKTQVKGEGKVFIDSRSGGGLSGIFKINIDVSFGPAFNDYPIGNLTISTDLSDSANSVFTTESIEQINSHGKHNPTVILTGTIKENLQNIKGCRYWLLIANNKTSDNHQKTDVVSFGINDNKGNTVAYGTGDLTGGNIKVNGI